MTDYDMHAVNEITGCWIWRGTLDAAGYGRFGHSGIAHREYFEHFVGPIPDGLELDHLCFRPRCVNPAHLEPVTHAENILRAIRYRRLTPAPTRREPRPNCSKGHPLEGDNVRIYKSQPNARVCLTCAREHDRRKEERRTAARRAARAARLAESAP